jgi:D-ribulokinase
MSQATPERRRDRMSDRCFIGVDVGTGSARAGVFDEAGALLGAAKQTIATWYEPGDIAEQSSDDVWRAVAAAVRGAVSGSGVSPAAIAGLGFAATCSLVVVDRRGRPLAVGPSEDPARNIIVWMDHRALDQARRINLTEEAVLRYVGGIISPEMETPKLLWLKEHRPAIFSAAGHFFDLPDFLTWRATGSLDRSACTVTCKWTYLAHERRWDPAYFRRIGLGELAEEGFARIGSKVVDVASPIGSGLTAEAAADLGLSGGIPVGAALIDAHAGGLGTVGGAASTGEPFSVESRIAYVFGTSACIMATTREATFVPGIWGPYFSAMVPGLWLNEAGQSAAGAALDQLLTLHPAASQAAEQARQSGRALLAFLEDMAIEDSDSLSTVAKLARDIHVMPEFLGNRSPHADPDARAMVAGLGLERDIASLVKLYVAGLCGLAYGARQVLEALRARELRLNTLIISGGAAQSRLVRQILADVTRLDVAVAVTPEPVLLGAAMLGAVAAARFRSLEDAMRSMSQLGPLCTSVMGNMRAFHEAKYKIYELLQSTERQARAVMAPFATDQE